MPETRYYREYTDGVLTLELPFEVSDAQLFTERLAKEANENHVLALAAYKNYGSLTVAQKDQVLKFLLGFYLSAGQRLGYFVI